MAIMSFASFTLVLLTLYWYVWKWKYSIENYLFNKKMCIIASKCLKSPQTSTLKSCENIAVLIMLQCQYCIHTFIRVVWHHSLGVVDDVWWYYRPLEAFISGTTQLILIELRVLTAISCHWEVSSWDWYGSYS